MAASPSSRYSADNIQPAFAMFLRTKTCLSLFEHEEQAVRNLYFWHHMQQYRQLLTGKNARDEAAVRTREKQLLESYIEADAIYSLNCTGQLRRDLLKNPHDRDLWLRAQDEVLNMILGDNYERMTSQLSETINRSWSEIKAKFTLQQVGDLFYKILFEAYPEVQPLFKMHKMESQSKMLADILDAAVGILTNLDTLCKVLWDLGQRHKAYQVQVAHYAAVGECLVKTLGAALGPSFDAPTKQAWLTVYSLVSTVMILAMDPSMEEKLLISVPIKPKVPAKPPHHHQLVSSADRNFLWWALPPLFLALLCAWFLPYRRFFSALR
eukprot:g82829.t1